MQFDEYTSELIETRFCTHCIFIWEEAFYKILSESYAMKYSLIGYWNHQNTECPFLKIISDHSEGSWNWTSQSRKQWDYNKDQPPNLDCVSFDLCTSIYLFFGKEKFNITFRYEFCSLHYVKWIPTIQHQVTARIFKSV